MICIVGAEPDSMVLTLPLPSHLMSLASTVLKPKVFHEYVNVSGIVLINNSSLSPVQPPVKRLYVLRRFITDDLRFDGIVKQVLRAESKLESPFLDILMPITFPIAGPVPCSVHAVFINRTFPASLPILSSTGSRISTGLWAFAWKYARDTSMCMIEKASLWFAAIDIIAFNASTGGVAAYRSGRSLLLNSLAHIRDLICIGFPSNTLSVSTHFVSTGVVRGNEYRCKSLINSTTISVS